MLLLNCFLQRGLLANKLRISAKINVSTSNAKFHVLFSAGIRQEIQSHLALHRGKELRQLRDSWDQALHLLLPRPSCYSSFQVWLAPGTPPDTCVWSQDCTLNPNSLLPSAFLRKDLDLQVFVVLLMVRDFAVVAVIFIVAMKMSSLYLFSFKTQLLC